MSDIYGKLVQHKILHNNQRHVNQIENPVSDFSCERCFPKTSIGEGITGEFLKFWKILCKVETQIQYDKYTTKNIISSGKLLSEEGEEFKEQ